MLRPEPGTVNRRIKALPQVASLLTTTRFICLEGNQLWRNLHTLYTRSPCLLHKRTLALDKLCPPDEYCLFNLGLALLGGGDG
jgi:hypothetical protein